MTRRSLLPVFLWFVLAIPPARAATMSDMLGRPVAVPDGPLRLVSLAPSLTEIVFALGRGDWLVGVTEFCDYPPAAGSKPRIGGSMTPNLERVVQVRPDVVLATAEGNPRDKVAELTRLGIPVFAVKPDGYAGVLASVRTLGHLLRAEADAAGPSTFIHDLIEMAGGENVVRQRAVPYPRLSWEEVLASAPEVILVATQMGGGDRPLNGGSWNAWQSIPAVRSGRILSIPGDTIHRPGPRVVNGLERLARAIHPEAFLPGGAR